MNGGGKVDEATKTITPSEGSGTEDKDLTFESKDKVMLQIKGSKPASVDLANNGYYFLNATNDTIIGSYVVYNAPRETADTTTITLERIQKSIDSLKLLVEGKNISEANKNFYVLPYSAVKVTPNSNAIIIAPFHQITTLEKDGDKTPEVYRFYSISQIREKIEKQILLTKPKTASSSTEEKK